MRSGKMVYKILLIFGVAIITVSSMTNDYAFASTSQCAEVNQLQYAFTDEENTLIELALLQDDGGEAARLISSLENEDAYKIALEQVLDMYYQEDDKLDSRLAAFSDALDERCEELLKDYAERNSTGNLVSPVTPTLTLNKQVLSLHKNQSRQLTAVLSEGKHDFVWESRNPTIAVVDKNGNVTGVNKGTTLIVVKCADNEDIFAMCAIKVSGTENLHSKSNVIVTSKVVNGYNNMIITSYSQMKNLIKKYRDSVFADKKILNQMNKYDEKFFKRYSLCLLTREKTNGYKISVGDVYIKQDSKGNHNLDVRLNIKKPDSSKGYTQIMKTHFCFVQISKAAVVPFKQNVNLKKASKQKMKVTWNKIDKAAGYQMQYCTDSKFRSGIKTITIKNNKTAARTISRLKRGKTYYVRVRSYGNIKLNGKTNVIYGSWSSVKKSGKM